MSAKTVCEIAWYAPNARAQGRVTEFMYKPAASTGNHAQHLKLALFLDHETESLYTVRMPAQDKYDQNRTVMDLSIVPAHEALHREFQEQPELAFAIDAVAGSAEWTPTYYAHPVAAGYDCFVAPLALYLDGFLYIKEDAILGITMYNLLTMRRHLLAILVRSKMCRCGCKGWCSLYEVFSSIRWSLESLADMEFPSRRHDGGELDPTRPAFSGKPLSLRGALVQIKGDWAEFAHSLGFPAWNSRYHPCPLCFCPAEEMKGFGDVEAGSCPYLLKSDKDYQAGCGKCERRVMIDVSLHQEILAALDGSRGWSLTRPIPPLDLLAGDRLEPSEYLRDVASFENMELPGYVVFWRPSAETVSKHNNPLFSPSLGVGLGTIAIDTLHCLHLGVLKRFVM